MKELRPFNLLFVEEPSSLKTSEVFKDLRRHVVTPIATGERNFTR